METMTDSIRVLIIQPDNTHEVREIAHDLPHMREIIGGWLERVNTKRCDLWFDEEGKLKKCPINQTATWLWWKLAPEIEGYDVLCGPVFVTGPDDGAGYSTSVSDAVIDLYERIRAVAQEDENSPEAEGP